MHVPTLAFFTKAKKMFYNPEAIEKLSKVARSYCLICQ